MPIRVSIAAAFLLVIALSAGVCAPSLADDSGWAGVFKGVQSSAEGNEAQVRASAQGVSGGQSQPAGDQAAPLEEGSGHNPWAKYTLLTDRASGEQQLCTTVNAGQAGVDGNRVQVCYDPTMPDVPDGPVATDPAVLAA